MPHTNCKFGCDQVIIKGIYLGNEVPSRLYLSIVSRDFNDFHLALYTHAPYAVRIRLVPIKQQRRPLYLGNKVLGVCKSDVWLTVHRNSVWIRKTN